MGVQCTASVHKSVTSQTHTSTKTFGTQYDHQSGESLHKETDAKDLPSVLPVVMAAPLPSLGKVKTFENLNPQTKASEKHEQLNVEKESQEKAYKANQGYTVSIFPYHSILSLPTVGLYIKNVVQVFMEFYIISPFCRYHYLLLRHLLSRIKDNRCISYVLWMIGSSSNVF